MFALVATGSAAAWVTSAEAAGPSTVVTVATASSAAATVGSTQTSTTDITRSTLELSTSVNSVKTAATVLARTSPAPVSAASAAPAAKPVAAKAAVVKKAVVQKAAVKKVTVKRASAKTITIRRYVNAPGSQHAIDGCNLVLWTRHPLWLAAHNWCGYQWLAFVPTGTKVHVTSGLAAGNYVVTGHMRLTRQGGSIPNTGAALVLQTCVGKGTGLTLLRRI